MFHTKINIEINPTLNNRQTWTRQKHNLKYVTWSWLEILVWSFYNKHIPVRTEAPAAHFQTSALIVSVPSNRVGVQ